MRSVTALTVRLLWLGAVLALAACSSTKIVGTWHDPDAGESLASLLVIARIEEESLRRMFEDRFAAALQDRSVNAVASYRVFPDARDLSKEAVEKRARDLGLRGVLIARLLGQEKVEIREPAYGPYPYPYDPFYGHALRGWPSYYRHWHSYYGYGYGYPYQPTLTREATLFRLEVNVYAAGSGNLVWSARTETLTYQTPEEKIGDVAKKVVRQLERDNLI
jgi:hypothetical protein